MLRSSRDTNMLLPATVRLLDRLWVSGVQVAQEIGTFGHNSVSSTLDLKSPTEDFTTTGTLKKISNPHPPRSDHLSPIQPLKV